MSRILYLSDLHYGHPYVAGIRGFGSAEEHDDVMLQNWNSVVRKDDTGIIPGDFAMNWKNAAANLKKMNGKKILIWGNHDVMFGGNSQSWKNMMRWIAPDRFVSVQAFLRRRIGTREFLVSHFPYTGDGEHSKTDRYTQFRLRDQGMWLVHGHTHRENRLGENITYRYLPSETGGICIPANRTVHAGADAWDMTPVEEEVLIGIMRAEEERSGVPARGFSRK